MSKSGFCWADEVEKEEEEEYLTRLQKSEKKPNPFGSARPREVVLQEKGVDWRELDQKLHQPSIPRKENQPKENVSGASIEPVDGKNLWGQGLEGTVENTNTGCSHLYDSDDSMVPPLRFPPKNYMFLMKENQWPNFATIPQATLLATAEPCSEQQKGNKIHELGMQRSLHSKRLEGGILGLHCYRNSYPRERDIEWEKENLVIGSNGRFISKESGHQDREWQNMNFNTYGRHFIQDRSPGIHEGRRGSIDGDWENMGRYYERRDCSRERLMRSSSITEHHNEGKVGYHYSNKEASCVGNYRNVGVRPLQEREVQNMDYPCGRQGFGTRRFEVLRYARAENHQDQSTENCGFGKNGKRSGMKLGNHQWRRKLN